MEMKEDRGEMEDDGNLLHFLRSSIHPLRSENGEGWRENGGEEDGRAPGTKIICVVYFSIGIVGTVFLVGAYAPCRNGEGFPVSSSISRPSPPCVQSSPSSIFHQSSILHHSSSILLHFSSILLHLSSILLHFHHPLFIPIFLLS